MALTRYEVQLCARDIDGADSDVTHICDKEPAAGASAAASAVTPATSGTCGMQSGQNQSRRKKKTRRLGLFVIPYIYDDSDSDDFDVDDADSDATRVSRPESSPKEEGWQCSSPGVTQKVVAEELKLGQ
ncbi:hypothetical protein PAMP_022871 [Pampus punctatissimus]